MKKLVFLFIFLGSIASAQKSPFAVYMACYTAGDTIPDGSLQLKASKSGEQVAKMFNLSLLKNGAGQSEAWLNTWEILVYDKTGKFVSIKQHPGSPTVSNLQLITATGESQPKKIVIQGITISVKEGDKTTERKLPAQTLYRASTAKKKCE